MGPAPSFDIPSVRRYYRSNPCEAITIKPAQNISLRRIMEWGICRQHQSVQAAAGDGRGRDQLDDFSGTLRGYLEEPVPIRWL
jgi:hypothetical protein